MGWQDAPEINAAPAGSPKWASAPVLDDPAPAAPQGLNMRQGLAQKAADGLTLGFGDENAAFWQALMGKDPASPDAGWFEYDRPFGERYSSALDTVRQQEDQFQDDHPIATGAAELGGGLVTAAIPVGAAAAGASMGAKALRGAAVGSGMGATYGFGEGEGGAAERAGGAVPAAAIGGVLGAAAPVAGAAAGGVVRGFRDMRANSRMAGEIAGATGVSPRAARLAADVVGVDDAAQMQAALNRPGAMLADAGPSTQGALDAVMQAPGEGARTARARIDERAAAAGRSLNDTLDATMGPAQGVQTSIDAIRRGTAGARSDAYDAAYRAPIDYAGDAGQALVALRGRIPASAIADANRLMQIEGVAGQIADDAMPDVRGWDYIKRALDHAAASGDGAGALGGQTPMGRAYQGLSREIRDGVAVAVPDYRTALDTAADAIGQSQGAKFGSELLRAGVTREDAAQQLAGMTGPELAAVRQGVRSSIDDTLANVRAVASDPNIDARQAQKAIAELSSPAARDKLAGLLSDDWAVLSEQIDNAVAALGTRARVATNSRTYGRQQFGEMLDDMIGGNRIASGKFLGASETPQYLWQHLIGATPQKIAQSRASVKNELADLLTRPEGARILNTIEAARGNNVVPPQAGQQAARLAEMLGLANGAQIAPGLAELLGRSLGGD